RTSRSTRSPSRAASAAVAPMITRNAAIRPKRKRRRRLEVAIEAWGTEWGDDARGSVATLRGAGAGHLAQRDPGEDRQQSDQDEQQDVGSGSAEVCSAMELLATDGGGRGVVAARVGLGESDHGV